MWILSMGRSVAVLGQVNGNVFETSIWAKVAKAIFCLSGERHARHK